MTTYSGGATFNSQEITLTIKCNGVQINPSFTTE